MTIKASLGGGAYEPSRATYKMGDGACDTCGSRQPHQHQEWQSLSAATGHDDSPPERQQPVRVPREFSRPDYSAARRDPWYHAYGNGGGGPSPATLAEQAEARRQTVEAQDAWHARRGHKINDFANTPNGTMYMDDPKLGDR